MDRTQLAVVKWLANAETGISSETLAFFVGFGIKKAHRGHPLDPADFNRCLTLLKAAPELREGLHKMSRVSPQWERLVAKWAEIEKTFIDEVGPDWTKNRHASAKKTYDLMKVVIDGEAPAGSKRASAHVSAH